MLEGGPIEKPQAVRQGDPQPATPAPSNSLPSPGPAPRGLTHQSRPHCSGQTPCTSLEITEEKLALAGPQ